MRRRGVGVAAITKKKKDQEAYQKVGNEIQANSLTHVTELMEKFKNSLEDFARKYRGKVYF